MSRTLFRVSLHSLVARMSGNSLLEAGLISDSNGIRIHDHLRCEPTWVLIPLLSVKWRLWFLHYWLCVLAWPFDEFLTPIESCFWISTKVKNKNTWKTFFDFFKLANLNKYFDFFICELKYFIGAVVLIKLVQFYLKVFTHSFSMNPFSTPQKAPETLFWKKKRKKKKPVLWCFQGVEKGCIGKEWVKKISIGISNFYHSLELIQIPCSNSTTRRLKELSLALTLSLYCTFLTVICRLGSPITNTSLFKAFLFQRHIFNLCFCRGSVNSIWLHVWWRWLDIWARYFLSLFCWTE